jgi:MFS family permease
LWRSRDNSCLRTSLPPYHHLQNYRPHHCQLGILAHAFPPSKMRTIAFATFAAGAPLGAAVGNTLGAVLTQLSESVAFPRITCTTSSKSPLQVPHGALFSSSQLVSMLSVWSEVHFPSTLISHQQRPTKESIILVPSSSPWVLPS